MTIDAIRSVAIRCQPRIADALERFASSEPSSSARIDAEADVCAAMTGFAAAENCRAGQRFLIRTRSACSGLPGTRTKTCGMSWTPTAMRAAGTQARQSPNATRGKPPCA